MITPFVLSSIVFVIFGLPASYKDIKTFRIPFLYVCTGFVFMIFAIMYEWWYSREAFSLAFIKPYFIAVLTGLIIYLLMYILSGKKISEGDIVFGLLACLYSSFPYSIISIAFAALICLLYYLFFAVKHTIRRGRGIIFRPIFAIPFVPFIFSGALLVKVMYTLLH